MQKEKLILSVITQDRPGIVREISDAVNQANCNIEDSRMMVLGGSFAILMMVSGDEQAIQALMARGKSLSESFGTLVQMQKSTDREASPSGQPYVIEVVSLDHPGIVRELSEFVATRNINIETLDTETYAAPHTGSPMFRLEMTVTIPAQEKISTFRTALVDFCDQRNLDVSIEAC